MIRIREYAVGIISLCSNEEISSILLQLVAALRYEIFAMDKSPLLKFLI